MKSFFSILLLLAFYAGSAQPKVELTPNGFASVTIPRPAKTNEKLIELSRAWAPFYNRYEQDVYNVTGNSITIDAIKNNAYFYRNRGEAYKHRIKYSLKADFNETTITLTFAVKEIYAKNVLTKTTVADFFAPDGRLKEDFEEVKPSLELTANNILRSYAGFISD